MNSGFKCWRQKEISIFLFKLRVLCPVCVNFSFWSLKATGFGDPHMVSLDGTPFTFNGHGEFFILKVSGVDFTLQGRMEPLVNDDGSLTDATVFTAFAAKQSGSDTVQVRYYFLCF